MNSIISRQIIFERIDSFAGSSKGLESFLKIVKGQLNELLQNGDIAEYQNILFELLKRLPHADGGVSQLIIENIIPENKHEIFLSTLFEYLYCLKPHINKDDAWTALYLFRIVNNYLTFSSGESLKNFLMIENSQSKLKEMGILNTITVSFELDPDNLNYSLVKKFQSTDLIDGVKQLLSNYELFKFATDTLLNLNLEYLEESLPLALEILLYIESLNNDSIRRFNPLLLSLKLKIQTIDWSVARSLVSQIDKLLGIQYSQAAD